MNKECEEFYRTIKDATLEVVQNTKEAKVFFLRNDPNSYMMSSSLIFAMDRIFISGDIAVSGNGVVSCAGYGIGWFSGHLEPSYLAEKFLRKKWIPEQAIECFKERGKLLNEENPDDEEFTWNFLRNDKDFNFTATTGTAMIRFAEEHADAFESGLQLYDHLPAYWDRQRSKWVCPFDCENIPSLFHDPIEVGWLSAIQRRFAECYANLKMEDR